MIFGARVSVVSATAAGGVSMIADGAAGVVVIRLSMVVFWFSPATNGTPPALPPGHRCSASPDQ